MKDERKSIASQRAWRTLESVCVAYVREPGIFSDYDEQKLDFELQRVKVQYGNDPFTVPLDRDLVKYLRSLRIGC